MSSLKHLSTPHAIAQLYVDKRLLLFKLGSSFGSAVIAAFAAIDAYRGDSALVLWLALFAILGVGNLFLHFDGKHLSRGVWVLDGIMLFLSLLLIETGGIDGTGVMWLYPILIIMLSIHDFHRSVIVGGGFLLICAAVLLTPLNVLMSQQYETNVAFRFIVTLTATYILTIFTLKTLDQVYLRLSDSHLSDIERLTHFDSLTGLPNRHSFRRELWDWVEKVERGGGSFSLLYIDLDHFKSINELYGHELGDDILKTFAERLRSICESFADSEAVSNIFLARLSGDEFTVLLDDVKYSAQVSAFSDQVLALFEGGFYFESQKYFLHASIGSAVYPQDATSADKLVNYAQAAMEKAKQVGNNNFQAFSAEIAEAMIKEQQIENGLRNALDEQGFSLRYMPIYDCHDLSIKAVEVLLRAEHPALQWIGPDEFIPVAEKTGLIRKIDTLVLEAALASLKILQTECQFTGLMCINISGLEMQNDHFVELVKEILDRSGVSPASVEIEITETAMVSDDIKGIDVLNGLKGLGVSLALDDFGTGYTAFSQLANYPVECLKIDRSFVSGLFLDTEDRQKMVPFIKKLAEIYELRVIAEGVENQLQLEYLRDIGCDWCQGYLLSKPLTYDEFVAKLS